MGVLQCKGETLCSNLVEWDIKSGLQPLIYILHRYLHTIAIRNTMYDTWLCDYLPFPLYPP